MPKQKNVNNKHNERKLQNIRGKPTFNDCLNWSIKSKVCVIFHWAAEDLFESSEVNNKLPDFSFITSTSNTTWIYSNFCFWETGLILSLTLRFVLSSGLFFFIVPLSDHLSQNHLFLLVWYVQPLATKRYVSTRHPLYTYKTQNPYDWWELH